MFQISKKNRIILPGELSDFSELSELWEKCISQESDDSSDSEPSLLLSKGGWAVPTAVDGIFLRIKFSGY